MSPLSSSENVVLRGSGRAGHDKLQSSRIMCLVVLGEQERGGAAVPFGDDPELVFHLGAIGRQQATAVTERNFVGLLVLRVELAPIAMLVPQQELGRDVT